MSSSFSGHQRARANVDRPSRLPRGGRLAPAEGGRTSDAPHGRRDAVRQHPPRQEDFPQQDVDGRHGQDYRAVPLLPLRAKSL